jgi:hypothetical protein
MTSRRRWKPEGSASPVAAPYVPGFRVLATMKHADKRFETPGQVDDFDV